MKFTREKVAQVYGVLSQLSEQKTTAKGAYAISKNKRLIESEVKSIQDAYSNRKIPEGVMKFEEERLEACKLFSNKDEAGEALVINSRFVIPPEKLEEFDKTISELSEKHAEALAEKDKLEKELADLLQEEIDLPLHKMKFTDIPDNVSASQLDILGEMIED
jgi:predicted transcriptional regulator